MPRPRATFNHWRSGLEKDVGNNLTSRGVGFSFEQRKIKYTQPAKERTYTPDFELTNGVIIETKGYFPSSDRQKMKWVQEQHPELDIRILFTNSKTRLNKRSPTNYAMWCEKNNYKYADKVVPQEWINEAPRH